jgi:hypothetical protein
LTSFTHSHGLHKTHTKWLVHSWSTFGARMSHGQHEHTRLSTARTWGSHHLPPYNILCDYPRRPHSNGFLSRDSRMGVPKSRQQGLPRLWSAINFRADLGSKCSLKQSYSPCRELSNSMWHIVYSQINRVDS